MANLNRLSRREFGRVSLMCFLTGSTAFGSQYPKDMDYIAIGTKQNAVDLIADGWCAAGSLTVDADGDVTSEFDPENDREFISLKNGGENIILTGSLAFFDRWCNAHDECVSKMPPTKGERIRIFRKHLYGEANPDEATNAKPS